MFLTERTESTEGMKMRNKNLSELRVLREKKKEEVE